MVNPCSMPFNLSYGEIESTLWMNMWLYTIFNLISVLRCDIIVWLTKYIYLSLWLKTRLPNSSHTCNICQMWSWAKDSWPCNVQALECHLVLDFTTAAVVTYTSGSWIYTCTTPMQILLFSKADSMYCLMFWNARILRRENYAHFVECRRPVN